MKKRIYILLFIAISIVGLIHAQEKKSESTLWKESKEYFERHSYKIVISRVNELIKRFPNSKHLLEGQILKGKSLVKLRRYDKGIKLLDNLIKQNEKLAKRADLMEFMGNGYHKWSYYSYADQAISYYKKAISLYSEEKNNKKIVTIYYKVINIYRYKSYYNEYPNDYTKQTIARYKDIISCYNEIIKVADDTETKVTGLYNKAIYIRDYYYDYNFKKDKTLKAFQFIINNYPNSNYSPLSQWEIASLYNNHGDYVTAIKEYEKLIKVYPNHDKVASAKNMILSIKAPQISLRIDSTVKPGEKSKLQWSIRNVKIIKLSAYKIDLFEAFKKVERLSEINNYSVKGLQAVSRWEFKTPDIDLHKYYYSDSSKTAKEENKLIEVPVTKSGAYIIKGYGENPEGKAYEVTTLIIISKLGLITKAGKEKTLFYTVDSITGKPIEKTDILIQRLVGSKWDSDERKYYYDYKYEDLHTKQGGIGIYNWEIDKNTYYYNRNFVVLGKYGDDYAVSNSYFYYYWYGYRRNFKIYGYSDRPVYRPNQTVSFKQIIRKYKDGKYENYNNEDVHVQITDPKGNKLFDQNLKTNEYGSVSGKIKLEEKPPLGVYIITVKINNEQYYSWDSSGNQFRVEEYKKPEYKVSVTTEKPTYKIGDKITFKILSKYYFGSPVVNADVEYIVYKTQYYHTYRPYRRYIWFYDNSFYNAWSSKGFGYYYPYYYYRRELETKGKLKTDKNGEIIFSISSSHFPKAGFADIKYTVEAKVVDQSRREIKGYGEVKVTNKEFYIYLNPDRYLYEKGETSKIKITAKNPNDQAVSFKGEMKVYPVKYVKGQQNNYIEQLGKLALSSNVFVGSRGENTLSFKMPKEGYYKIIVSTKDNRGEEITNSCYVWIAKEKSEFDHYRYKDIEIILDKDTYVMGETANVLINTKHENSYVLLTGEADDIYFHKVIFIKGKSKLIQLPITENLSPNIWLTASVFNNNNLYRDSLEVIVPPEHKYLNVKITAPKQTFK
ncbi:MAG: MG2 domain-containing protein, partial [Spirochaetota bacterium]|nr:MG2 domain-containing protein [Spirochaetota bacterium]